MDQGNVALLTSALGLGVLHGLTPAHGWLIASAYGLMQARPLAGGVTAAVALGLGHFVSSVVEVLLFVGAARWLNLGALDWMPRAVGLVLVGLGAWQLWQFRLQDGQQGGQETRSRNNGDAGLWTLLGLALFLGFAHQGEVAVLGVCAGSGLCVQLMMAYALTVLVVLVASTLLVVAGVERWRPLLERWTPHLPAASASILIATGLGFLTGVL